MSDVRHIVVAIKVLATILIPKPHAFRPYDVQRLIVECRHLRTKQPRRRAEISEASPGCSLGIFNFKGRTTVQSRCKVSWSLTRKGVSINSREFHTVAVLPTDRAKPLGFQAFKSTIAAACTLLSGTLYIKYGSVHITQACVICIVPTCIERGGQNDGSSAFSGLVFDHR